MVKCYKQAPHISLWPHTTVIQGLNWLVTGQEHVLLMEIGLDQNLNVEVINLKY